MAALGLGACGSDSTGVPSHPGDGIPDAAPITHPDIDAGGNSSIDSYSVSIGPLSVAPLEEKTMCVVKRLGNPAGRHFGQIHNLLPLSHHMIIYKVADTTEQPTPFACQPFADTLNPAKGAPLIISQKNDDMLQLPDGAAYTLDADQMIRLELHYINYDPDNAISITATSTLTSIADADYQNEANILFIGDPDISINAHQKLTLGPIYFPLPTDYDSVNFFAITGHEHHWGTNVTVATTPSKTGADTMVYNVANWMWSDPATVYANPPFQIPANGGFHFTCTWENTSDAKVRFGESANDEMCFFWAYYYAPPAVAHDIGAKVCLHTDQFQGGYDLCCPGDPFCNVVLGQIGGNQP